MNKNRRFVVSEFVKICDELDLLLEAIMLGMATAGNVTVVQVIYFQSANFLSSLLSTEQAELVGFEIFLNIRVICWTLSTFWFFRLCIIFISFDSFYNWYSLAYFHIFRGFFLFFSDFYISFENSFYFFSTIFLDDIYEVFFNSNIWGFIYEKKNISTSFVYSN